MGAGTGTPSAAETAQLKLEAVRECLAHQPGGTDTSLTSHSILLSEALLSRAPSDYLTRVPTEALAHIVREAAHCYQNFLRSDTPSVVEIKTLVLAGTTRSVTVILTAVPDRPFIVDTLTELLRVNHLHHRVLLHPIIRNDDQRLISLTYLELPEIEDCSVIKRLQSEIEERFAALAVITDDFGASLKEAESAISTLRDRGSSVVAPEVERKEVREFLRWLIDGGFVFLGVQVWEALGAPPSVHAVPGSELGIFRIRQSRFDSLTTKLPGFVEMFLQQKSALSFAKALTESPVHRYALIDLVFIKLPGLDGTGPRVLALAGLLTSKAMSHEAASVPIIRRKLQNILQLEGLLPNSHSYKEFLSIANSIPKSELLQLSADHLRDDIQLVMTIQGRSELRVRTRPGPFGQFLSVLVTLPQRRYSGHAQERIRRRLEELYRTTDATSEYHVTTADLPLVILHYLLPTKPTSPANLQAADLEREIEEIVVTWDDRVREALTAEGSVRLRDQRRVIEHYCSILPESYKAAVTPSEGAADIRVLESLTSEKPLEAALAQFPSVSLRSGTPPESYTPQSSAESPKPGHAGQAEHRYSLTLYKQGDDLTLSAILPFLENVGFSILQETVTPLVLRSGGNAAIYKLLVRPRMNRAVDLERASSVLLPGLKLVLSGEADNDHLNELMLFPGLTYRQISVLRVLTSYLWQIKAATTLQALISAIVENPTVAALLVDYFVVKFDPKLPFAVLPREAQLQRVRESIQAELRNVVQLAHDRSLRQLLNVIDASVRTNFFRATTETRIALKIECKKIERMPNPRPLYEIFVSAPDFEGVHLRGGKVARGGIRWSDRVDDFRTEVLGLMKTQMVKNAIIVPVGAKGGFVLKQRPTDQKLLQTSVKECYRRYIRSLLEITDNRVDGELVHPPETVIYDEPDPYFVVAADRGTAALSDVANELAMSEFNFWLGDAFASGGSNGYDHKKLAITARGVWETTCRHFREIGIDPEQQEFTVVGIGDMSGDVFGNGLLLSRKARLIAAFDHRHIFLDPQPAAESSFEERRRIFNLPQSSWKDYNPALISPGGGVFDRNQKEIPLTAEAQAALGTEIAVMSGQELMRTILRAPADLLWNGGIGTYVKATEEDNLFVGDRANDDVRVDAKDLRVKVVGEGGNLGFTQRGRIEYSRIGGHINTDAIDNSGGVNTSDLEVNAKILLSAPVRRGVLSLAERNTLLMSIADDVCETVLARNRAQSLALSVGVRRSRKNLGYLKNFISSLEQSGLLDRKGEVLPDDATLDHRMEMKAGLTRPELAVLLGYAKMSLFQSLMASTLPEDPFLNRYLIDYFPPAIGERYRTDILNHPLRREIICTQIANCCIERMGITFVTRSASELGVSITTVVKAFIAAEAILRGAEMTQELEVLDRPSSTRQHIINLIRLGSSIDQMVRWLVDHRQEQHPIEEIVNRFGPQFEQLVAATDSLTTTVERNRLREATRQLVLAGASRELAQAVASLPYSTVYLDISETASICRCPVLEVAKLFSELYVALHVRPLLEKAAEFEPADRWQASAIRMLMADVRRAVAKVGVAIIGVHGSAELVHLEEFLKSRKEMIERFENTYSECSGKPLDVPALLVLTNQLFALSRV